MIDVAHDGDDRRPLYELGGIVGRVEEALLDVGFGDPPHGVAHLFGDELRRIGVDHVGDLHHLALLHQQPDHVHGALGHAVGQLLDGDGLRNDDLADEFFLGLGLAMTGHALSSAPERCDRALAHFVGAERGHNREAAAALLGTWTGRRLRRDSGPPRSGASARPRRFLVIGFGYRTSSAGFLGLVLAETLLGFLLGLALGFFLVTPAVFLVALACVGGVAFGAFGD